MARSTYTRDDVSTHSDGFRESRPAVNVKVYGTIEQAWPAFEREEGEHDPRFTLAWIEEHMGADELDSYFWGACEAEYEYLEEWATNAEDSLFPDDRITLEREGRSGGWIAVDGLPEIDEWDAVRLGRWRRFERIAREIADGIPHQMLVSIYINAFAAWADEQADESVSNAEMPVDLALAGAL